MNVDEALRRAAERLRGAGVGEAAREAEHLLTHAAGLGREQLVAHPERALDRDASRRFEEAVERRAAGCPAAYITRKQEFFGLSFYVDERVLVPRPETEFLVEEALRRLPRETACIVDVGTGSGCVAVALKTKRSSWNIVATDVSREALDVARRNAAAHGAALGLVACDLLSTFPEDAAFDAVVSNPPYIGEDEWKTLDKSVREFEPSVALLAKPSPASVVERLLPEAHVRLKRGGFLIMEISPTISGAARELAKRAGFLLEAVLKDYAGLERVVVGRKA
ncbi:MAG: peptide chain release factor N(5)-glutamine methyltransferase [Acidobacteriota bacterium]|nr:MAG: peptide chain release factor N(5)-glutamine methyltransferase [Acidobacteriota bacterium]